MIACSRHSSPVINYPICSIEKRARNFYFFKIQNNKGLIQHLRLNIEWTSMKLFFSNKLCARSLLDMILSIGDLSKSPHQAVARRPDSGEWEGVGANLCFYYWFEWGSYWSQKDLLRIIRGLRPESIKKNQKRTLKPKTGRASKMEPSEARQPNQRLHLSMGEIKRPKHRYGCV